jgi:hypothetical protein
MAMAISFYRRPGLGWRIVMSVFTWLQNRTRGFAGQRRTAHGSPRRQTTFRPRLEVLEGREVPSTLKVTNLNDSGKGSLRYEIAAAQSGDTIVIEKSGTIQLTSGSELYIGKNLSIQGPGAGKVTITSWPFVDRTRIFEVRAASVSLSGLTIRNGGGYASSYYSSYNDGDGGAILNDFGTLTISNCVLTGNSASTEGGSITNFATLIVTGCTLSNNSATNYALQGYGGGIYNNSVLTVSGCTFSGNSAGRGGAILNDGGGTLTISGSTLSGNSVTGSFGFGGGGAIYNAGTATVSGCTLTSNAASSAGGGIDNASGPAALAVSNSMFSNNTPDNIYGGFTDGGGNKFS